jgi:hypothetical protein
MAGRMEALLTADPDCGLAHCLKGYLFLMGFRADAPGHDEKGSPPGMFPVSLKPF